MDFTTVVETEVVDGVTVPLLTDNGGPVETIALLPSSPAVDAGDDALAIDGNGDALLLDQRGDGFRRFADGNEDGAATVDIGAFEFGSEFLLGDVDQNGFVNFLDIAPFIGVLTANSFQAEADANQDGAVNFLDITAFIDLLSPQGSALTTAQFFAAATAPPEPAPLVVAGASDVRNEDDSRNVQNAIPEFGSTPTVVKLSEEKTDSRARQQRHYHTVNQVSSQLGASKEPAIATSPADLFDSQPELLDEIQDFELDEIFEGLPT